MRIVSGKYKGKNIIAPKGLPARPTTDYAKESLFNVLNNKISFEGINVLDLFAGTGNIGYEFMSRGASNITSVESDFKSIQFIKKMNKELELNNKVIRSDVFRFIKSNKGQYDRWGARCQNRRRHAPQLERHASPAQQAQSAHGLPLARSPLT